MTKKYSDPVYIVTYCIKWVTTSWTDGKSTDICTVLLLIFIVFASVVSIIVFNVTDNFSIFYFLQRP